MTPLLHALIAVGPVVIVTALVSYCVGHHDKCESEYDRGRRDEALLTNRKVLRAKFEAVAMTRRCMPSRTSKE